MTEPDERIDLSQYRGPISNEYTPLFEEQGVMLFNGPNGPVAAIDPAAKPCEPIPCPSAAGVIDAVNSAADNIRERHRMNTDDTTRGQLVERLGTDLDVPAAAIEAPGSGHYGGWMRGPTDEERQQDYLGIPRPRLPLIEPVPLPVCPRMIYGTPGRGRDRKCLKPLTEHKCPQHGLIREVMPQ